MNGVRAEGRLTRQHRCARPVCCIRLCARFANKGESRGRSAPANHAALYDTTLENMAQLVYRKLLFLIYDFNKREDSLCFLHNLPLQLWIL